MVGLSIAFMTVNIGGGIFSFLSLVFKEKFDVFASTTFVIIVVSYLSLPVEGNMGLAQ